MKPHPFHLWFSLAFFVLASAAGAAVIVAVIDTGLDFFHPAFTGRIYTNAGEIAGDGLDNDGNGYVDDVHGYDFYSQDADPTGGPGSSAHGTQVAGRVLQGALDAVVSIMPLRVGPGPSLSLDAIVRAIDYAARMGARIINMSFGTTVSVSSLQNAVQRAADQKVVMVAAAGNSGTTQKNYPAAYDKVVSVAATNAAGRKTSWSSYGSTVDFSAPGENVETATWGGGTAVVSGTSFSAPFVAGVMARILAALPELSPKQLSDKLISFSKDIDALNPRSLRGKMGDGFVDEEVAQKAAAALPLAEGSSVSVEWEQARRGAEQLARTLAQAEKNLASARLRARSLEALVGWFERQGRTSWMVWDLRASLRVARQEEEQARQQRDRLAIQLKAARERVAELTARAVQAPVSPKQWTGPQAEIHEMIRKINALEESLHQGLPAGLNAQAAPELVFPEVREND